MLTLSRLSSVIIPHIFFLSFTGLSSGPSSGVKAGICVSLLIVIAAVVGVIFRRRRMNRQGKNHVQVIQEQNHVIQLDMPLSVLSTQHQPITKLLWLFPFDT